MNDKYKPIQKIITFMPDLYCPKCNNKIVNFPFEWMHHKSTYRRFKEKYPKCTKCGIEFDWDDYIKNAYLE